MHVTRNVVFTDVRQVHAAFVDIVLHRDADQTALMLRLICVFVVLLRQNASFFLPDHKHSTVNIVEI